MPHYSTDLLRHVDEAVFLARAGDGVLSMQDWGVTRVQFLYELAYLRIFIEWERFLEKTFMRYLCGYVSSIGACAPIIGTSRYSDLSKAESAVRGNKDFLLWHNPNVVVARAQQFLQGSFHETVVASNSARLVDLAAVRHRIAHGQEDAIRKFNSATMNFAGRRYLGARPGRFLRDWDRSVAPPKRWLESLGSELSQLALQIA